MRWKFMPLRVCGRLLWLSDGWLDLLAQLVENFRQIRADVFLEGKQTVRGQWAGTDANGGVLLCELCEQFAHPGQKYIRAPASFTSEHFAPDIGTPGRYACHVSALRPLLGCAFPFRRHLGSGILCADRRPVEESFRHLLGLHSQCRIELIC